MNVDELDLEMSRKDWNVVGPSEIQKGWVVYDANGEPQVTGVTKKEAVINANEFSDKLQKQRFVLVYQPAKEKGMELEL